MSKIPGPTAPIGEAIKQIQAQLNVQNTRIDNVAGLQQGNKTQREITKNEVESVKNTLNNYTTELGNKLRALEEMVDVKIETVTKGRE